MRLKSFKIFIFFYLFCSVVTGQQVIIRTLLDTNKALIGDQLKLQLLVDKSDDIKHLNFPLLKDTLTEKIEIINISPIDTSIKEKGRKLLSQEILISVFDTGLFEVPALQFVFEDSGQVERLNSLPVSFEIIPLKSDSTIRDIKAIYKMPLGIRDLYPYIIALMLLVILVWILIYYVKRRKNVIIRHRITAEKQADPPDVVALRELNELSSEKPWTTNKIKYYYSRLSEILRTYIEGQFKTLALEQTTEEILSTLRSKLNTNDFNRLAGVLRLADFVKFAKVIPDSNESSSQIDYAIEFVNSTSLRTEALKGEEKEIISQNNSVS